MTERDREVGQELALGRCQLEIRDHDEVCECIGELSRLHARQLAAERANLFDPLVVIGRAHGRRRDLRAGERVHPLRDLFDDRELLGILAVIGVEHASNAFPST